MKNKEKFIEIFYNKLYRIQGAIIHDPDAIYGIIDEIYEEYTEYMIAL